MKAFVDTNILIDYICKREPFFIPAKSVFAACYMKKVEVVVSGLSIVNLLYICRKCDLISLKANLLGLSQYIEIVDLPSSFVINGLKSGWSDYEDFLQNETAISNQCDCIISRNSDDFSMSCLPVYNASDFMLLLNNV